MGINLLLIKLLLLLTKRIDKKIKIFAVYVYVSVCVLLIPFAFIQLFSFINQFIRLNETNRNIATEIFCCIFFITFTVRMYKKEQHDKVFSIA